MLLMFLSNSAVHSVSIVFIYIYLFLLSFKFISLFLRLRLLSEERVGCSRYSHCNALIVVRNNYLY